MCGVQCRPFPIGMQAMRLSSIFAIAGTFFAAAIIAVVAAGFSAGVIEDNSRRDVRRALDLADMSWAEVDADGLQVFLAGTAPTEATRFKAISVAGGVVDATRVTMPPIPLTTPRRPDDGEPWGGSWWPRSACCCRQASIDVPCGCGDEGGCCSGCCW